MRHPEIKQPTPAERFVQLYSVEAYRKDFDQLGATLLSVHPNALKFISKKEFLKTIEEKKALINEQTTYTEFAWYCREIIANVNCSHTSLGGFYTDSEMLPISLRFPVQTNWIEGKLFVTNTLDNSKKVALQDEITSINGVDITKIMRDIYKRIPSQGHIETSKRHFFNSWSTDMIPYVLNFPKAYEVQIASKEGLILLNAATTASAPFSDKSVKYCKDDLCLNFPNEGVP
jgi:hypothetical protein